MKSEIVRQKILSDLVYSAQDQTEINSTIEWINIQKSTTSVSLNRTSLKKLRGWNFDQNQSSINHISGGFFSINGTISLHTGHVGEPNIRTNSLGSFLI